MSSVNWNQMFTAQLRKSAGRAWGAFEVATPPSIGDFGILHPDTSTFSILGNIATWNSFGIPGLVERGDWSFTSSGVTETKAGTSIKGAFFDPETMTTVEGGVEFAWTFSKSNSMLAQIGAVYARELTNIADLVDECLGHLCAYAGRANYVNNAGYIQPGFVVVSQTFHIVSGLIVGAASSGETFSVKGAADVTNNFVEGKANGAFSFADFEGRDDGVKWTWPAMQASLGQPASSLKNTSPAIGFQVVSWDGSGGLVADWIK